MSSLSHTTTFGVFNNFFGVFNFLDFNWELAIGRECLPLESFSDVYKMPQPVYQMMHDVWYATTSKEKVKEVMLNWLKESHSDKDLVSFVELSNVDVERLSPIISGLTFGIYCKLTPKIQNLLHEESNLQTTQKSSRTATSALSGASDGN